MYLVLVYINQKSTEYSGYSPENSKMSTNLRAQVKTPQSHLGERLRQLQEGEGPTWKSGQGEKEGNMNRY